MALAVVCRPASTRSLCRSLMVHGRGRCSGAGIVERLRRRRRYKRPYERKCVAGVCVAVVARTMDRVSHYLNALESMHVLQSVGTCECRHGRQSCEWGRADRGFGFRISIGVH